MFLLAGTVAAVFFALAAGASVAAAVVRRERLVERALWLATAVCCYATAFAYGVAAFESVLALVWFGGVARCVGTFVLVCYLDAAPAWQYMLVAATVVADGAAAVVSTHVFQTRAQLHVFVLAATWLALAAVQVTCAFVVAQARPRKPWPVAAVVIFAAAAWWLERAVWQLGVAGADVLPAWSGLAVCVALDAVVYAVALPALVPLERWRVRREAVAAHDQHAMDEIWRVGGATTPPVQ